MRAVLRLPSPEAVTDTAVSASIAPADVPQGGRIGSLVYVHLFRGQVYSIQK